MRALALLLVPGVLAAQARAPVDGSRIESIGQPKRYHWFGGTAVGGEERLGKMFVTGETRVGVARDMGNPILGLASLQLEAFAISGGGIPDAGARARLMVPFVRAGVGVERAVTEQETRFLLSFVHPVQRGGVFGDGSQLRFDISPFRTLAARIGIEKPFQRGLPPGRSRPRDDHVRLDKASVAPTLAPATTEVRAALVEARQRGAWIGRMTIPWLDHRSPSRPASERAVMAQVAAMRRDLTDTAAGGAAAPREMDAEVRAFHGAITRAFAGALAVAADGDGRDPALVAAVAAQARTVLLDEVLLPYDRLLGQLKIDDTTNEFARRARGIFLRWLHVESAVPPGAIDGVLGVFFSLLELVEQNRARISAQWGDSRFTWLPLQYALLPEEHDTQRELDALVERATGDRFSDGNLLTYAINEQAQYQFSRMIQAAREYHVLWIHDFRGTDDGGDPDEQSYRQVLNSYLRAMTDRVRAYDSTGTFPTYLILLDEWFYEWRRGRMWMTLLESPLTHELQLPAEFAAWEDTLRAAQDSLRAAVRASRLLQSQKAQFGERWLRDLVRVHVNITNPSDWSFFSRHLAGNVAMSDNILRDHRKISFYDVTEEDPYRGEAMLTGAGIGENYSNISWEDRSILVRGPATLHLKEAAREVLLQHGLPVERIPWHLRPRPRAADYDARVRDTIAGNAHTRRAVGVHNATGYGEKDVNVAKAVLYTLLPAGSVIKAPDSIWNASFWGAALAGCALRGGRVLVIAPSLANSPVWAFGSIEHAHDLLWRLLVVSRDLAPEIAVRGGLLRVGIYTSALDVTQVPAKVAAVQRTFADQPWLRELFGFPQQVYDDLARLQPQLDRYPVREVFPDFESDRYPKLHLKANLFASREAWTLMARSDWPGVTAAFVQQRMRQVSQREVAVLIRNGTIEPMPDIGDSTIDAWRTGLTPEAAEKVVFYTMVGSHNHNARSMVTDGEAALVVSGWPSVIPILDLIALIGQSRWPTDPAALDLLIPPESAIERYFAHKLRLVW